MGITFEKVMIGLMGLCLIAVITYLIFIAFAAFICCLPDYFSDYFYPGKNVETIEGKITKIKENTIDGNSHYYIFIEDSDEIFDVSAEKAGTIVVGDRVELKYQESGGKKKVLSIKDYWLQKESD